MCYTFVLTGHLRACWLAEAGRGHPAASRPAGPPGPWRQGAAGGWPGEALVWVSSEFHPGCAGGPSSGRPETPPATTQPAAASGRRPASSGQPPTRELGPRSRR